MPELKRDQPEARETIRLNAVSAQIANDTRVAAEKAAEKLGLKPKRRQPARPTTWSTVQRTKAE